MRCGLPVCEDNGDVIPDQAFSARSRCISVQALLPPVARCSANSVSGVGGIGDVESIATDRGDAL